MCVIMAAVTVWLDRRFGKPVRKAVSQRSHHGSDYTKYHGKTFKLIHVVDGDTFDIDIPDGEYDHTRIRLLGIDTPETKRPGQPVMYFGHEASDFAKQLASDKNVTVTLDTVNDSRDRYGRLLGHIKLPNGKMLAEEMVRNGFAYADLRFDNDYFDELLAIQNEAIKTKKGLWKEVTKSQLPKWLQRERPSLLEER